MPTEERSEFDGRFAVFVAHDLAVAEINDLVRSPAFKKRANQIVQRRPVRAFLLYSAGPLLNLASMAAGIVAGAWLLGLPMQPGAGLAAQFPLSFMIPPGTDPWYRYLFLIAIVTLATLAVIPYRSLRARILRAWSVADAGPE